MRIKLRPLIQGVTFKVKNRIPTPGFVTHQMTDDREEEINPYIDVRNCTFKIVKSRWFKIVEKIGLGFFFRSEPIVRSITYRGRPKP